MTTATIELPSLKSSIKETAETPTTAQDSALKLMRKAFEPHQISKMCKSTKKDNPLGRCTSCGGWHKVPAFQISYVGHAALTDRLLDADPEWKWEPLAYAENGTPLLDADGGMWIKLTVAGVTRLGYGDAQGKTGGDAMKERIGDALRNAAMRFGAALELWHKGTLHMAEEPKEEDAPAKLTGDEVAEQCEWIANAKDIAELQILYRNAYRAAAELNDKSAMARYIAAKDARKKEL